MANSSATNAAAVDSGCPAVTLGDDLQLQARTWGLPFTADVFNVGSDPSDAERAGYIKAQTFHLEQKMSFYNNKDEIVAHATKPFFTWGVDRTKVRHPSPSPSGSAVLLHAPLVVVGRVPSPPGV
jgi:hypothetical protein